jgi:2,3-diketo-5-methylthio-1-phosphopentane phosphatase
MIASLFLDFDGTITSRDATDAILETFADAAWLDVERAWLSGHIGSRECLAAQMALVSASAAQVDRLLETIDVDPGFARLLDAARTSNMPVHIVSDGFDYCIRRILGRPDRNLLTRIDASHIISSSLEPEAREGRWRATFRHPPEPCAHGCATCKLSAMRRLTPAGSVAVFAGDGMSDRYAASGADIVFAKDKLAAFCEKASIAFTPFETLGTLAESVERLLRGGRARPATGRIPTGV